MSKARCPSRRVRPQNPRCPTSRPVSLFRFVCVRQLRWVRKQFNEYKEMTRTLLCVTLISVSYALVVVVALDSSHQMLARRLAIVCESSPLFSVWLRTCCRCCRCRCCLTRGWGKFCSPGLIVFSEMGGSPSVESYHLTEQDEILFATYIDGASAVDSRCIWRFAFAVERAKSSGEIAGGDLHLVSLYLGQERLAERVRAENVAPLSRKSKIRFVQRGVRVDHPPGISFRSTSSWFGAMQIRALPGEVDIRRR